jgi:hypothetical protein
MQAGVKISSFREWEAPIFGLKLSFGYQTNFAPLEKPDVCNRSPKLEGLK